MRQIAWLAAFVAATGCYLSPDKHQNEQLAIEEAGVRSPPEAGTDAGIASPTSCSATTSCGDRAPVCSEGTCTGCSQHADCARFAATPACGPTGACVPCAEGETRLCAAPTPACDPEQNRCVECAADSDCTDPLRSACNSETHTCAPCATNNDCAHVPGKGVCFEGACVECTKNQVDACRDSGPTIVTVQYVCDPKTHSCDRTRPARSKGPCDVCISDLECDIGHACVDVPAGAGQSVCQQIFTSSTTCLRPYILPSVAPVTSVDGERVSLCTLGVEGTTCEAHRQYNNTGCGLPSPIDPMQDILDSGSDARCGVEGRDDGFCVYHPTLRRYLCTVACNNSPNDCPASASRGCTRQLHYGDPPGGQRNLCSL